MITYFKKLMLLIRGAKVGQYTENHSGGATCSLMRACGRLSYVLLLVWCSALGSPVHAQSPIARDELVSLWQKEGELIFKQLGIKRYQRLLTVDYFSMPQLTWLFQEEDGFNQFINALEKSPSIFSSIEVLPGQFLLFNTENPQQKSIVLWVKRQHDQAYSGALSFMQATATEPPFNDMAQYDGAKSQQYSDNQLANQKKGTQRSFSPLSWLPSNSTILLDIQSNEFTQARQWIYLLPFSLNDAKLFMERQLQQHHWQLQPQYYPGMQVWRQEHEQLLYALSDIDGQTSLFVMKKHFNP